MGRNRRWKPKTAQAKHDAYEHNIRIAVQRRTDLRKADLRAELTEAVKNTAKLKVPK